MPKSKEHQLWEACTTGDFELVKVLASDPAVDINWGDPDYDRTGFYRACGHNRVAVVEFLLKHPEVDVNKRQKEGASAFLIACESGHEEVVSLLLADVRVDVNKSQNERCTPFFMACYNGHKEVVSLLLADSRINLNEPQINEATPFLIACERGLEEAMLLLLADSRIDVNQPNHNQCTPLWFASMNGYLPLVQLLLVSGREIDTKTRSLPGTGTWNNKTAAEMARYQGTRAKIVAESDEIHNRKKQNGPLIAMLLDSFDADPTATRHHLRELPGIRDPFIGDLFALVIFLCEDLLTPRVESSTHKAARFFQIAQALPMELQMVVCNRVFGSGKNSVLTKHSEPAFKKLGRSLAQPESH